MKVVYKHLAVQNLQRTQECIETKLGNLKAAQKLISSILHVVSLLQENPTLGIPLEAKFGMDFSIRFLSLQSSWFFVKSQMKTR